MALCGVKTWNIRLSLINRIYCSFVPYYYVMHYFIFLCVLYLIFLIIFIILLCLSVFGSLVKHEIKHQVILYYYNFVLLYLRNKLPKQKMILNIIFITMQKKYIKIFWLRFSLKRQNMESQIEMNSFYDSALRFCINKFK